MANVFFKKGLLANLPESYSAGTFYVTTDERAMYLDIDNSTRIRLGDFIQVNAVANLPTAGASTSALYYCVAENILAKWNGSEWTQINKQPTAEEMKTLLGLGSLAYKSEVAEGDLNADLKAKVNAAAEGNHSHDNKALLDTYTQTEANLADAVAKKHAHTFNETELNKIAEGDVAKWNGVVADHLTSADKTTLENAIKEAKKAGTDANTALEAYKVTNDAAIDAIEEDIAEIVDGTNGILAQAKSYTDGKDSAMNTRVAALETAAPTHALKTEVEAVDAKFANYNTTVAQKAIDDAQDAEIAKKVNKTDYEADKATFATKTELGNVDAKFASYNTTAVQKGIDDAQDVEIAKKVNKVEGKDLISTSEIERLANVTNYDDTQVKADIAKKADTDTMTTELGKKVDKVTGYSLVSDTEIARLAEVDNYDDTAVRGLIKDNADAIDAIEADYLKTADKTALSNAIALKADKSVVDAMYTNDQIDGFLNGKVDKTTYAEDKATFALKSEITSLTGKADKSYVDEELAKKVNVADYNNDKATFALKTDLNAYRTSADQDVIDNGIKGRLETLEAIDHDKLAADASAAAVATVLDGAPEKFDTLKEIAAWIAEADTAEDAASLVTRVSALEAIDHEAYVGADAALKQELEGKINAINDHSHTFVESELNEIKAGDVAKWNNEIGAKALAETKTTTAEVKTQIEAYGYATEADLTLAEGRIATLEAIDHEAYKAYADQAEADAIATASSQDAVVLAEAQAYAEAQAQAVSGEVTTLSGRVSTVEETVDYLSGQDGYWSGKQDALTEDQMAAVNSGITADELSSLNDMATAGNWAASELPTVQEDVTNIKGQLTWGEF